MDTKTMARKQGRPKGNRNDVTVRLDADIKRDLETIAASRDLDLNVYLSDLLRPIAARELALEIGKMQDRLKTQQEASRPSERSPKRSKGSKN
jgi:hypothetical protein